MSIKISSRGKLSIALFVLIILIDQTSKIWIKTHMNLYESINITNWFKIYFVENNGMAFGIQVFKKLFLSVFRVIAVVFIVVYLIDIIKRKAGKGLIVSTTLVLAGAFGNIIDSMFYGLVFTESLPNKVAHFVPIGKGYASFLHGKVVDMLYFPLIDVVLPSWVPFWGNEQFIFFRPIFNFADASISVGVCCILLFFRKSFLSSWKKDK